MDLTGRLCYADANDEQCIQQTPSVLLVLTPPCHDYSSSNPDPKGKDGQNGGCEFANIPGLVKKLRPLCVLIEEVGNVINFKEELVKVLLGLRNDCDMVVHSACQ